MGSIDPCSTLTLKENKLGWGPSFNFNRNSFAFGKKKL